MTVLDGHNWSHSELIQAINRNNRGGENAGRQVFYDPGKLAARGLTSELKKDIKKSLGLSPKDGDPLSELVYSAKVKDKLKVSDALVFQIGESAFSRGVIEPIKKMITQAYSLEDTATAKKLEKILAEAIEHNEGYDVTIALNSEAPAARIRNALENAAKKAEQTMQRIVEAADIPGYLKGIARATQADAERINGKYEDIIPAYDSASLQHANSLLEVAEIAKRRIFVSHVLSEDIRNSNFKADHPVAQVLEMVRKNTVSDSPDKTSALNLEQTQTVLKAFQEGNLANGIRGYPQIITTIKKVMNEIPLGSPFHNMLTDFLQFVSSSSELSFSSYLNGLFNKINSYIYPTDEKSPGYYFVPTAQEFAFNRTTLANALVALINPNLNFASLYAAIGVYKVLNDKAKAQLDKEAPDSIILKSFLSKPTYFLNGLLADSDQGFYLHNSLINKDNAFSRKQTARINKAKEEVTNYLLKLPQSAKSDLSLMAIDTRKLLEKSVKSFMNKKGDNVEFSSLFANYQDFVYQAIRS